MPPHKSAPTCGDHEMFDQLPAPSKEAVMKPDDVALYLDEKGRNEVQRQKRELVKNIVRECWRHFRSASAQERMCYADAVRSLLKKKSDASVHCDVGLGPMCQIVWDEFLRHRIHNLNLHFDSNDLADSDYDSE